MPGIQMYQAIWRCDGEAVGMFYMHAASEADVRAEAAAFLAEHPELNAFGKVVASIGVVAETNGLTRRGDHADLLQREDAFAANASLFAAVDDARLRWPSSSPLGILEPFWPVLSGVLKITVV